MKDHSKECCAVTHFVTGPSRNPIGLTLKVPIMTSFETLNLSLWRKFLWQLLVFFICKKFYNDPCFILSPKTLSQDKMLSFLSVIELWIYKKTWDITYTLVFGAHLILRTVNLMSKNMFINYVHNVAYSLVIQPLLDGIFYFSSVMRGYLL
jgi:hypothetical protein